MQLKHAAHDRDDDDDDDTFVTCADEADAMRPDDGGCSLRGESHEQPGGQVGGGGHHPHAHLADDRVAGVHVVSQYLPHPHRQSRAVQHGGVGQGQGGQVNVHR